VHSLEAFFFFAPGLYAKTFATQQHEPVLIRPAAFATMKNPWPACKSQSSKDVLLQVINFSLPDADRIYLIVRFVFVAFLSQSTIDYIPPTLCGTWIDFHVPKNHGQFYQPPR
jgi:hypothetical protein